MYMYAKILPYIWIIFIPLEPHGHNFHTYFELKTSNTNRRWVFSIYRLVFSTLSGFCVILGWNDDQHGLCLAEGE